MSYLTTKYPTEQRASALHRQFSLVEAPAVVVPTELKSRTLETLTGIGDICEGDRPIARVRFLLAVTRETIAGSSSSPRELPDPQDISGVITILDGKRHLADGSTVLLRLGDGRQWEFVATAGSFLSDQYVVTWTGREEIIVS